MSSSYISVYDLIDMIDINIVHDVCNDTSTNRIRVPSTACRCNMIPCLFCVCLCIVMCYSIVISSLSSDFDLKIEFGIPLLPATPYLKWIPLKLKFSLKCNNILAALHTLASVLLIDGELDFCDLSGTESELENCGVHHATTKDGDACV